MTGLTGVEIVEAEGICMLLEELVFVGIFEVLLEVLLLLIKLLG